MAFEIYIYKKNCINCSQGLVQQIKITLSEVANKYSNQITNRIDYKSNTWNVDSFFTKDENNVQFQIYSFSL